MRVLVVLAFVFLAQCSGADGQPLNSPFPASEQGENVLYSTFVAPPKTLDPAVCNSTNECTMLAQIYEPPLQYHYLKRPYELVPLTLTELPRPRYLDAAGREISKGDSAANVARVEYDCHLKAGILYHEHPAFAKDEHGRPFYDPVPPALLKLVTSPDDFPNKGTRELRAGDYVNAIRRLASPTVASPVRESLAKFILGFQEYTEALTRELELERSRRRMAAGDDYNQAADEAHNPIVLDLSKHSLPGAVALDDTTFRITLKKPYSQILYWMAMPAFSPVPPEAESFYRQPALADQNITLDQWPVGTGAFYLKRLEKNRIISFERSRDFRGERYPSEAGPDETSSLLADAGKPMPFLDRVNFILERESVPSWNKFLQGYYDSSGIASDSFERAVTISPQGSQDVSAELKAKEIVLNRQVSAAVRYLGFNMMSPVVGGLDEKRCKLRQAIGLAIDTEEHIQIFANGRGIVGMSPIPPGTFGYEEGEAAMDPHLFTWDTKAAAPRRKPIDEAKRLMVEAGYPGGIGPDGRQLSITFDNAMTEASDQPFLVWIQRAVAQLGVHLDLQTTDYNRFQEKLHNGSFQLLMWGWDGDYPDPENFLGLFYGPKARAKSDGDNATNYINPEYDQLFLKMEDLEDGPERLDLIRQIRTILQHDSPWIDVYFPVEYSLAQSWLRNQKPNNLAINNLKYLRVDTATRSRMRREWNSPNWRLFWAGGLGGLLAVVVPWYAVRRRERRAH